MVELVSVAIPLFNPVEAHSEYEMLSLLSFRDLSLGRIGPGAATQIHLLNDAG
jgi:hypothetical protein